MIIAGIDPSLSRTAVASGQRGETPTMTILGGPSEGQDVIRRFERYRKLVASTIKAINGARFVFIEGYSFASQGRATVTLGEYGGCLRAMLLARDIEVIEIAPAAVKKFVTGVGNASKPKFMVSAARQWSVEYADEDEYFAHAIYRIGCVFCRVIPPANKHQAEVVEQLRGAV